MKTMLTIALLLNGFTGLFAAGHELSDSEKEIRNSQPAETMITFAGTKSEQAMHVSFRFTEEAYVNDIPFNTTEVALVVLEQKERSSLPKLAEEAEIEDIPFNTASIAESYLKQRN